MIVIERVIDIDAPPETVWTVMRDVERWPTWCASVTSVELLDPPRFEVGSRVRVLQPRLPAAVWTVTDLEEERRFEWESSVTGLKSVASHFVEPGPAGGTRATLSIHWTGPLAPLLKLIYGKLSERYVEMEANGLKDRSEALQRLSPPQTEPRP